MPVPRILIVDSDPSTHTLLRRWFKRSVQAEAAAARTALEALERLSEESFSIVVLSIAVRLEDDGDLLAMMRKNPRLENTIIIATAETITRQHALELIQNGVSDLILKPLRYEKFVPRIQSALESWQQKASCESVLRAKHLPTLLIADPDAGVRDLARKALESRFHVEEARNIGELLSTALRVRPDAMLVSEKFPGLRLRSLLEAIRNLTGQKADLKAYLLVEDLQSEDPAFEEFAGLLLRTRDPAEFRAEAARLIQDLTERQGDEVGWLQEFKSGFPGAVQEVCDSLTGVACTSPDAAPDFQPDRFGSIRLTFQNGAPAAAIAIETPAPTIGRISTAMLDLEDEDIHEEVTDSTLSEMLNVLGARIRSSAAANGVELTLKLPEVAGTRPADEADSAIEFMSSFLWGEEHPFRVAVNVF